MPRFAGVAAGSDTTDLNCVIPCADSVTTTILLQWTSAASRGWYGKSMQIRAGFVPWCMHHADILAKSGIGEALRADL